MASIPVLSPNASGAPELVEHRQQQVRHVRVLREPQMPAALQLPGRAAREDDRQRAEVVLVAVAQRAAVEDQRVIEQRAVAVRRRLQLLEEVGELRHVVGVQLRELIHVAAVVRVMRQVVERIADARLREDGVAELAREHQRRDARDLRLEREHLQVEHQLQVLLERRPARRPAHRAASDRRGTLLLGALNPPLDLAHLVEILRQPATVAGRQILLQRRAPAPSPSRAGCATPAAAPRRSRVGAAVAEQLLEHELRVVLHRQRRRSATSTRSCCGRRS